MRILLVEDDDDIREVLGLILEAHGHLVEQAVDGQDALDRLQRGSHPSLILLDLMLPRLDGEGFLRAIRSDPGLPSVPVCVLSGHPAAREKARQLGAIDCLVKPIEFPQLLGIIESVGKSHAHV